jgi:transcription initiation factor TFIID subunit 1, fungi type
MNIHTTPANSRPSSPPSITQQGHVDYNSDAGDALSAHGSTLAGKNKILVINRLIKNETGGLDWKSEVITDGRVINAYLRHRKMIEKEPMYDILNVVLWKVNRIWRLI